MEPSILNAAAIATLRNNLTDGIESAYRKNNLDPADSTTFSKLSVTTQSELKVAQAVLEALAGKSLISRDEYSLIVTASLKNEFKRPGSEYHAMLQTGLFPEEEMAWEMYDVDWVSKFRQAAKGNDQLHAL